MIHYLILSNIILTNFVYAQLSPGDLHKSHADLEGIKNCNRCHGISQKITAENCLNCHTLLKDRTNKNLGLHANPDYQNCIKCHVEHHGRDFDLIWWPNGQENFDHSQTGFSLLGKHRSIKCRDCHQEKFIQDRNQLKSLKKDLNRTFIGLGQNCLNCHHDEHRGQLGKDCKTCHQTETFKSAPLFDHSRSRFPLTGKHTQVRCEKCHPLITDRLLPDDADFRKFKDLVFQKCQDCHQDAHQNRFGSNCSGCHNTTGWKNYNQQAFNHQQTRFPLIGKHQLVACEKCHLPGKPLRPLTFKRCQDCHSDYHQGQFTHRLQKGACEECHTVQGFKPAQYTIEQHNQTSFKLEGGHLAVPCTNCHNTYHSGVAQETIRFKFNATNCGYCHIDPHAGTVDTFMKNEGCEFCHSVQGWRAVQFDHGKTSFPLEFKHLTLACTACHQSKGPGNIKITKLSSVCQDCHKDPHQEQFVVTGQKITRCERCHSPKNWKETIFDHNSMATFKLEGAHRKTNCNKCHMQVSKNGIIFTRYKPIPHECVDCHGKKPSPENQKP